ncbi:MAG: FAD-binding oxidoreductase [Gemmatimonadetes bacterium]|nr:FAD-binding oxidoreductase [Gemmatimonadota bacterium]
MLAGRDRADGRGEGRVRSVWAVQPRQGPPRRAGDRLSALAAAQVGPAEGLRGVLPRERILSGTDALPWSVWPTPPAAVVFPESTDEAATLLARASEEGWTVEPAGSGTWLWSGSTAAAPDIVLSASRMKRVVEYEPADLTITVQAGMTLTELEAVVAPHRQWLPLDPPGRRRSLGAVASTGVWGPLGASWGGPRDLTLGLRAVTGDGRAFGAGGRVVKNVAGFDLVRLLIGSRGALAFITEVTTRLLPRPEADRTLVLAGASLEELAHAAVAAYSQTATPAAVELVERRIPLENRWEAVLAVRLIGLEERVRAEEALIGRAVAGAAAGQLRELSADEAIALWREVRHLEDDADLALRMSISPARLPELVELARALGRMRGGRDELARSPVRMAMHGGAGALRVAIPNLRVDSGWAERWADRLEDVRRSIEWRGGTLSVTRAPAALLPLLDAWRSPSARGELMAGIKAAFDPAGILSVDRFVLELAPRPSDGGQPQEV